MFSLVLFWVAVYGLANAIAILKAGVPIRAITGKIPVLSHLFKCPTCLSFWIGMGCSFWFFSPASQVCPTVWKHVLVDGVAAAGFSYMAHVTMEKLGFGIDSI